MILPALFSLIFFCSDRSLSCWFVKSEMDLPVCRLRRACACVCVCVGAQKRSHSSSRWWWWWSTGHPARALCPLASAHSLLSLSHLWIRFNCCLHYKPGFGWECVSDLVCEFCSISTSAWRVDFNNKTTALNVDIYVKAIDGRWCHDAGYMFIDEECFKGLFVVLGATSVAIDTLAPPLKLQAFRWLMISENWARDARSRLYATGLKDTFNKTSLSLFFFFALFSLF